jgi:hypothetical protein
VEIVAPRALPDFLSGRDRASDVECLSDYMRDGQHAELGMPVFVI